RRDARPGADGEDPGGGAGPGARRVRVRGGGGVVRLAGEACGGAVAAVVRAAGVPGEHRGGRALRGGDGGDGEGAGGGRGGAHGLRGRRAGERAGRGLAEGAV